LTTDRLRERVYPLRQGQAAPGDPQNFFQAPAWSGLDEPNNELIATVKKAIGAHLDALVDIARDLDRRLAALLNFG
jgi:Mg2+ and Co2+ transporter CorA